MTVLSLKSILTPKESNMNSRGMNPTVNGDLHRNFPLPLKNRLNA
jgi:hypothetical protein